MAPFDIAIVSVFLMASPVILAPCCAKSRGLTIYLSFAVTAAASLAAVAAGILAVHYGTNTSAIVQMGLPDLPFHLRLDPLAGFFLCVIGLLSLFVSIYSIGYVKGFSPSRPIVRFVVFYALFIVGMLLVVLADDAFFFLVAWELMAASSYFLVMYEDEKAENRRSAYLYLVIAHVGAIAILLSFGVMAGLANGFESFQGYTFDSMRATTYPVGWATAAFLLSFFGFAAKAGVIPLHVWLPEAHPVAPSNISALMSGVMLKTSIYGIVRITFDFLKFFPWWWGGIVLVLGLISAVLGVLYALMQHDLKRLLAYHSVENIGIILIGLGLSMIFTSFQFPVLAALALIAALYHTLNHAMFKGLLFMGAGAVLHATHERNMEEMGGLIHRMPWTSVFFLVGCVSIAALPPFNGFVSEWLTFQAFLLSPALQRPILNLLIPLGAALLALTGALAAACFVKAFGVTFLGHWRGHQSIQRVHEVGWHMRTGMMLAAVTCFALGIFPTIVINWMDVLPERLVGGRIAASAGAYGWMWLTPYARERASYSGFNVFIGIMLVVFVVWLLLHARKKAVHRVPIWDCGFEKINARMQYTATSFSMPIRRIFGFFFHIREESQAVEPIRHPAYPEKLQYRLRVRDRFWNWLYKPIGEGAFFIARKIGNLQQGRIQVYLIYSLVTIIVLLVFLG
ncbi:MAG: formate hydrogenlyase subunit 3/multisubunit Na+/H+ antiporter MnhD [Geobacteraceae bacterium]|nr:MAG: formate hydrogenlyase subunit 3/multisubunit Na+/H+ antiporter MnhD [Geobacteraceae bacterium]